MKDSEQLAWEAENGPKFAVAAFVSGALTLIAIVIPLAFAGGAGAGNEREGLLRIHDHSAVFLTGVAVQGLAYASLAAVFYYLLRAITARRAETLNFLWPLIFAAPVLLTIGAVLTQINLADIADSFLKSGPQTVHRAKDLVDNRSKVSGIIASLGTLSLALSFVFIGVNAMRAGLFSRFMGILGIIAGALLVLPLLPGGGNFVQLFWVVALGVLLLDRWPKGRGPAWNVVDDLPWPTAAQVRGVPEAPTDPPRTAPSPAVTAGAGEGDAGPDKPARTRNSRKKKRKRR